MEQRHPYKHSERFGAYITEILNGDSFSKAEMKCNSQLSAAYIWKMSKGKVPGLDKLKVFFDAYNARADWNKLLELAGYEHPHYEIVVEVPGLGTMNIHSLKPELTADEIQEVVNTVKQVLENR